VCDTLYPASVRTSGRIMTSVIKKSQAMDSLGEGVHEFIRERNLEESVDWLLLEIPKFFGILDVEVYICNLPPDEDEEPELVFAIDSSRLEPSDYRDSRHKLEDELKKHRPSLFACSSITRIVR
ncbi:MAG: hypothetical protein NUW37_09735, partial [Planctomycetes bacterium]|nr:hypothetical protein [Planctomycetota bacterium]